MENDKPFRDHEYVVFCKEVIFTAVVFIIVALIALGLQVVITFFEGQGMSEFVVKCLTYAEYAIVVGDLLYLIIAVAKHIAMFAVSCWHQVRQHHKNGQNDS